MNRFVNGEGPAPCPLMFIGEAPGHDENRIGRPFVGKTGMELNRYIRRALSMDRSECYVTNLIKRLPEGDGTPTTELVKEYSDVLAREIDAVNPTVIVSLGRWSTHWFLPGVDMDTVHGIPHLLQDNGRVLTGKVLMPIFHPAAGLHNTELQGMIGWDFARLRMLLDGNLDVTPREDPFAGKENYDEIGTQDLSGPGINTVTAIDTEGSARNPWGWSASCVPGSAIVGTGRILDPGRVVLHNSLHDLSVLRALHCDIGENFDDNMVMAYLLCVEPQGLKQLSRRHLGMEMQSYDDVMSGAIYRKSSDYLLEVWQWLDNQPYDASKPLLRDAPKKTRTRGSDGKKSKKTCRENAKKSKVR
jgi:uracil-DNA glycosylase family 4